MMMTAAPRPSSTIIVSVTEALGAVSRGCHHHMTAMQSILKYEMVCNRAKRSLPFQHSITQLIAKCSHSTSQTTTKDQNKSNLQFLRGKKIVPDSDPPSTKDANLLYQFFDQSRKLMVLTGAGMSTESGIPDYRSPNGAYSSGFKPITHQEFVRSSHARRRYWARSYAGWRRFAAAQPSAAHHALASLEKVGRINFMVTQNVDRLHHRAGSDPLELHGTVYAVVCLQCSYSISRDIFQDQVKVLNPKWASAIESLECGNPGSDKSFGMQQRPDGDIEIDEKFWEQDFNIPNCPQCGGILKPDVVFFGDNVPKERADKAMEAAKGCDALLVLGSSLMTMSAFRLARLKCTLFTAFDVQLSTVNSAARMHYNCAAFSDTSFATVRVWLLISELILDPAMPTKKQRHQGAAKEAGAPIAIINIGETRADEFVSLKISARCGEILPRLLEMGCLAIPGVS